MIQTLISLYFMIDLSSGPIPTELSITEKGYVTPPVTYTVAGSEEVTQPVTRSQ